MICEETTNKNELQSGLEPAHNVQYMYIHSQLQATQQILYMLERQSYECSIKSKLCFFNVESSMN